MQVAVRFNGQPWWNATDSGSCSLQAGVAKGNTVDFMAYGGYYYGNTPFRVLISVGQPFL